MAISASTPDILGERQYGQDVRTQNGILSLSTSLSLSLSSGFPCFFHGYLCSFICCVVEYSGGLSICFQHSQNLTRSRWPRQGNIPTSLFEV